MIEKRYYLDDLFPKSGTGGAQVPYIYGADHNALLNHITKHYVRGKDASGRVFYDPPRISLWRAVWNWIKRMWRFVMERT